MAVTSSRRIWGALNMQFHELTTSHLSMATSILLNELQHLVLGHTLQHYPCKATARATEDCKCKSTTGISPAAHETWEIYSTPVMA